MAPNLTGKDCAYRSAKSCLLFYKIGFHVSVRWRVEFQAIWSTLDYVWFVKKPEVWDAYLYQRVLIHEDWCIPRPKADLESRNILSLRDFHLEKYWREKFESFSHSWVFGNFFIFRLWKRNHYHLVFRGECTNKFKVTQTSKYIALILLDCNFIYGSHPSIIIEILMFWVSDRDFRK